MSKNIPLDAIPNQAFTINLDSFRYDFVIKEARGVMSVSIARDNVWIVKGERMVAGTPLLPYDYQEKGNFILITEDELYPDYNLFKTTQQLVYLTIAEVATYLATGVIEVGSFKPTLSFDFLSLPRLTSTEGFAAVFARASLGTYYNSAGLLITAAIDNPRFDYNPETGAARGLLHESSGTNIALRSEEFNDAVWTKTNSSIVSNSAVAPDGSSTADKLVDNSSNAQHITVQSGSFTSGQTYTLSAFLSAGEIFSAWIFLPTAAFSSTPYCFVNLLTGTLATPVGCTATLEKLPGGRYRIAITATATATTSGNYGIGTANGLLLANATYVGNGSSGIYIWGVQLEIRPFASSYIKTLGSSATRAAELVTLDTDGWLAEQIGTLFTEIEIPHSGLAIKQTAAELSDASASNSLAHFIDGTDSNKRKQLLKTATVTQYSYDDGTYAFTGSCRSATSYQTNAVNGAIDGTLATTDSVATMADYSQLTMGSDYAGNNNLNGWIKQVNYYAQAIRNAILKTITE